MALGSVLILSLAMLCVTAEDQFLSQSLIKYTTWKSNPDVLPQTSADEAVEVKVSLSLINIQTADPVSKNVNFDAWLTMKWDGGFTFDPAMYNNLTTIGLPAAKVWRPDLAVYNGELTVLPNELTNRIIILNNGVTLWIPQTKIRVVCNVTDTSPTSVTTCRVKLGSWTYSAAKMSLADTPEFDAANYDTNSAFEVIETSAVKESKKYACCPEQYEHMMFTFSFRRK